jgi:hypothetical protein
MPRSLRLAASRRPRRGRAPALLVSLLAAACASTEVGTQWSDPQFAGRSLRGARLLVVCEAAELPLKRQCQDRLAAELIAFGATPVIGAEPPVGAPIGRPLAETYLPAARDAGAKAIFSAALSADATVYNPGPSVGVGIGGFGGGHTSVGGGIGISLPVGGYRNQTALGATGILTDVASGRTMWTGTANAPASNDLGTQVGELARAVVAAAGKAGHF